MARTGRRSKLTSLEDAARLVADGTWLALGGTLHFGRPVAFVNQVLRNGTRDLVFSSTAGCGYDLDLLVALGRVAETYVPMVLLEPFGLAPSYRRAAESGAINAHLVEANGLTAGYLASAYGHPFHLVPSVAATDFPSDRAIYTTVRDEDGRPYVAARALRPDVCVLLVPEADEFGNCRHRRSAMLDNYLAMASRVVVVLAERILASSEVRADPLGTTIPGHRVHHVVHAPFGAHPCATVSQATDEAMLRDYFVASRQASEGNGDALAAFAKHWVFGVPSHGAYVERHRERLEALHR